MSTATTNWWNSQDLQQAIYTAHFPQKTGAFLPIAQIVRATPKRISSPTEAGQSKTRRVILSARKGTLLKFGYFAHTGLLSGVVVVLSKAFSKEHHDAVNLLIRDSSLKALLDFALTPQVQHGTGENS